MDTSDRVAAKPADGTATSEPERARPPTLKTIAFMTGYSVTAVSRALKDAPDISAETRERVKLVAQKIGYRPSRAGLRLRTGKTQVISLVLDTDAEIMGLTTRMFAGIAERLRGTDYHLTITPYSRTEDEMAPVSYVTETGAADGIIISRIKPDDPRIPYLIEHGMVFATHGRSNMGITHAWHDFDNERYASDAVDWLVAKNCRRPALVGPPDGLSYANHMRAGFSKAANRHDVDHTVLTGISSENTIDEIARHFTELMHGPRRPDGIVCGAGGAAIGVVAGAEAAGLEIGKDFQVVSKQSTDILTRFRPQIHVINENVKQAGYDLADFIIRQLDGEDPATLNNLDYGN